MKNLIEKGRLEKDKFSEFANKSTRLLKIMIQV